jgi:hypothetical protein
MKMRYLINLLEKVANDWDDGFNEFEQFAESSAFGRNINEGVIFSGPIGYDDDNVTVIENPSRNDFIGMMNRSRQKELRGLLDVGRFLIWDAYLATHADIINAIWKNNGVRIDGADLELTSDEILMNSFYPHIGGEPIEFNSPEANEQAEETAKWLRDSLKRFYPSKTTVTLVLDGGGDSITLHENFY